MRRIVTGLIIKDGKVLLLRRKLNWKGWELVKGRMSRETPRQALLREIREETNLRVKIIRKLGETVYTHKKIQGHTASRQIVYLCEYVGGSVKLSFEHSAYRWVTKKQAFSMLTHSNQKKFMKKLNI